MVVASSSGRAASRVLRVRGHGQAKVSNAELFFDLVYVFAVTQLSHKLLGDLTLAGALQTLLLWFAVWLGWQYTCWVTNWFDPEARRILGWVSIAALCWLAGAWLDGPARVALWVLAVACEYVSPMFGFALPGLGRSRSSDWTIDGGHLAERCQLFVIVALGESVLLTGATFSISHAWHTPTLLAFGTMFMTSLAMWWVYFDTTGKDGTHAIEHSADPGRLGAYFHYVHVLIVAGVIVGAVAAELVIAHPHEHVDLVALGTIVGGAALYLLGNAMFKCIVYRRWPRSHAIALPTLAALAAAGAALDRLVLAAIVLAVLLAVAVWDGRQRS